MQFVVAWLSVRSSRVYTLVESVPTLLFYGDHFLQGSMRVERVTKSEVLATIRASGLSSMDEVAAVVLEMNGSLSVVHARPGARSALAGVVDTGIPLTR